MRYRVKLYLSFLGVAIASILIALALLYTEARSRLFREHQSKIESIAATGAKFIDAELVKMIKTPADENSDAYNSLRAQLLSIRNVNRRKDVSVKFVYVLKPSPEDPKNNLIYLLSSGETYSDQMSVGQIAYLEKKGGLLNHLDEVYAPSFYVTDEWSRLLYGYAPIYDENGEYVATLAINIYAEYIEHNLNKLIRYGVWALVISITLAWVLAHILAQRASSALGDMATAAQQIGSGNLSYRLEIETNDEFSQVAMGINKMAEGIRERDWLKRNFSRYVSHYIMEKILQSETPLKLEGQRKKVTVLFSDIRGFTYLAEHMSPEQVVALLNQYFEIMLEVIFKYMGTLDKFIGDGIMVEFGSPLEDDLQERHALLTSIEMQEKLLELCEKWKEENKPQFKIGIGIHTGEAIIGNIGTEKRMEYTAIGNTVNIAAHLEKLTKKYNVMVITSEQTQQVVRDEFDFEFKDEVEIKDCKEKVRIYTLSTLRKPRSS